MSAVSHRSQEKESFWRLHLDRHRSSGESIRGYCRVRGLSDALFHFWRREIARRDGGAKRTSRRSRHPGLIPVEIVDCKSLLGSAVAPQLEIECPGGPVIRVREEASLEVLQRVMKACRMSQGECGHVASEAVRSC